MTPGEEAAIAKIGAQVEGLSRRFDEHAQRTEQNFSEVKEKQDLTNGRVTKLEKVNLEDDARAAGKREGIRRTTGIFTHPIFLLGFGSVCSICGGIVVAFVTQ